MKQFAPNPADTRGTQSLLPPIIVCWSNPLMNIIDRWGSRTVDPKKFLRFFTGTNFLNGYNYIIHSHTISTNNQMTIYIWWILRSRKITNTSYLHPHLFLTCQQCSLLVGNPPLNQIYFILFLSLSANIRWNSKEKLDTAFASRLGWNKMGPFHF